MAVGEARRGRRGGEHVGQGRDGHAPRRESARGAAADQHLADRRGRQQGIDPREVARLDDQDAAVAVLQRKGELPVAEAVVERHQHAARPQYTVEKHQIIGAVGQKCGDPVSRRDAALDEKGGHRLSLVVPFLVRERA